MHALHNKTLFNCLSLYTPSVQVMIFIYNFAGSPDHNCFSFILFKDISLHRLFLCFTFSGPEVKHLKENSWSTLLYIIFLENIKNEVFIIIGYVVLRYTYSRNGSLTITFCVRFGKIIVLLFTEGNKSKTVEGR